MNQNQINATTDQVPAIQSIMEDVQMISARELYEMLGLDMSHYSRWCNQNILNNATLEEGVDFKPVINIQSGNNDANVDICTTRHNGELENTGLKPRYANDYMLTMDVAESLAMETRSEKGKEIRQRIRQQNQIAVNMFQKVMPYIQELTTEVATVRNELQEIKTQNALLESRCDCYDSGIFEKDEEQARWATWMYKKAVELQEYYGVNDVKIMIHKIIKRAEEIHYPLDFNWYVAKYKRHHGLNQDAYVRALSVAAYFENLQEYIMDAYNRMCDEVDCPNDYNRIMHEIFDKEDDDELNFMIGYEEDMKRLEEIQRRNTNASISKSKTISVD